MFATYTEKRISPFSLKSTNETLSTPPNKLKILVVEDEKINRINIQRQLSTAYDLEFAENGKEALAKINQFPNIVLIVMDLGLPDVRGSVIAKRIRQDRSRISEIPIIAHTTSSYNEVKKECEESGINDYVEKPSRNNNLCKAIQYWLASSVGRFNYKSVLMVI